MREWLAGDGSRRTPWAVDKIFPDVSLSLIGVIHKTWGLGFSLAADAGGEGWRLKKIDADIFNRSRRVGCAGLRAVILVEDRLQQIVAGSLLIALHCVL
jgi:hypothetical protein